MAVLLLNLVTYIRVCMVEYDNVFIEFINYQGTLTGSILSLSLMSSWESTGGATNGPNTVFTVNALLQNIPTKAE